MNGLVDAVANLVDQHSELLWVVGIASVALLAGTALLVPLIIILLPEDIFIREPPPWRKRRDRRLILHLISATVRNLIGLCLLVAGILMLFTPGQGVLTIVLALVLIDFPGKRALVDRAARNPRVMAAANRVRRWAGKRDFLSPDGGPASGPDTAR